MSTNGTPARLESERIVIQAPMSFTGSLLRCKRMIAEGPHQAWAVYGLLLPMWWLAILVWYSIFGILVIPYRLIRRGQRKRLVEEARHREQLAVAATIAPAGPAQIPALAEGSVPSNRPVEL